MLGIERVACAGIVFGFLFILGFSANGWGQTAAKSKCLSYEPAVAKFSGRLVRKAFPGPPEYKSTRTGDKAEIFWLLRLDRPICVSEDKDQPDSNPARADIRELQLVVPNGFYPRYRSLVGQHVSISGTLFGEHTIHHRTSVLLTVKTLAKAD